MRRAVDEAGDDRRDDDPDVEVLEGLDVVDDPGQQVAAAVGRQAGRGERLDRGEEPDPQVGEDPQRRLMGDDAFEVPERGTADREDADRGDRDGDVGDVRDDRGTADEVGRHRHQRDVRADRQATEARRRGRSDRADSR